MSKPKLLDLYCCAGGTSVGYAEAGFEVEGVDHRPQPNYPYTFHLADALEFLDQHWQEYDAFGASPPCPRYSMMLNHGIGDRNKHPDLIAPTRKALQDTGKPYVIENVVGAPLEKSIMLCGAMFGLRVYRHRWFESNILLFQPHHPKHIARASKASRIPRAGEFWSPVGCFGHKDDAQRAMGISWMQTTGSRDTEIANAIPPAYTAWIAPFLLAAVQANQEVAV